MCEQNNNIKQQFNQEFCVNVRNLIIERLNKKRNCKELENLLQLGNFEYRVNIEDDKRKRKYLFIRKDDVEKFIEFMMISGVEKQKLSCFKKYGSTSWLSSDVGREQSKKTILKKYGVENISQNEEIKQKKRESTLKTLGVDSPLKDRELMKSSIMKKYGVDNVAKNKDILNKRSEHRKSHTKEENIEIYKKADKTKKEKYGENYIELFNEKAKETDKKHHNGILGWNTDKSRQTYFEKTGYYYSAQNPATRKNHRTNYYLDNYEFDSSWEVAYYIHLRDNNIDFEYHTKSIKYEYDGKEHFYIPDFYVDGKYVEIKGGHLLKKNVFNENDNRVYAKRQCMIDNNVIIISDNEIRQYLNYVFDKYGKSYIKSLRK